MGPADGSKPRIADGAPGGMMRVEVVYAPGPMQVDSVELQLPPGASALDAVHASGLLQRHGLEPDPLLLGIWCHRCEPDAPLRDRDRVEIYRPLRVDPKEARRQRYKRQRDRSARGSLAPRPVEPAGP